MNEDVKVTTWRHRCLGCDATWTGDTYEDIACTCPWGAEPEFTIEPESADA